MNIFILSTGRCGSTTFMRACKHIENFTSGHETRCMEIGVTRFQYADNHIESDNRLSWFLGRLDKLYGDEAYYVHLKRNKEETVKSFTNRFNPGTIMNAYVNGIVLGASKIDPVAACEDYYETVNANIEVF